jgi:hypothetical protein
MNMPISKSLQSPWLARNVTAPSGRVNGYVGVNKNRQSRFEDRRRRREGRDWGILGVPTAMLWFDELELAAAEDEIEAWEPAIIDIW